MNNNFTDIQSIIVQVEIRMEVWFDFIFQKLNQIKTSVFEIIVVQKNTKPEHKKIISSLKESQNWKCLISNTNCIHDHYKLRGKN